MRFVVLLVGAPGDATSEEAAASWITVTGTGAEFPVLAEVTGVGESVFGAYQHVHPTPCVVDPEWTVVDCMPLAPVDVVLSTVAEANGVLWAP